MIESMDPKSQEYLNTILTKEPKALSQDEVLFLRARRSYLKKAQLEEYEDILNPKTKPPKQETVNKNAKQTK